MQTNVSKAIAPLINTTFTKLSEVAAEVIINCTDRISLCCVCIKHFLTKLSKCRYKYQLHTHFRHLLNFQVNHLHYVYQVEAYFQSFRYFLFFKRHNPFYKTINWNVIIFVFVVLF